jgi:WD40 repeat protein/serine/threonine protein kinase
MTPEWSNANLSDREPAAPLDTVSLTSPVQGTDWDLIPNVDQEIEWLKPIGLLLDQALQVSRRRASHPTQKEIGQFKLLHELGSGGCATVYLALDPNLGRPVAIKLPHPFLLALSSEQDRFIQEAKIVAVLRHQNIVEIYQVGGEGVHRYLVFEYCSAGSLAEWLERNKSALCPRVCAGIMLSLARAIDHAHQNGIVHRDVNPRNVLLSPLPAGDGNEDGGPFPYLPKLSDFGLGTWLDESRTAVRTQTGEVLGTLPYMAPEQTRADVSSQLPAVDLYALGVMLYEMLAGVRPFVGSTHVDTLRMIREVDAVPPRRNRNSIPRDLETICLKCLEKAPSLRYASARLIAEDLDSFLAGEPIRARRIGMFRKAARWIAKRRFQVCAGFLAVLICTIFLPGHSWLARELQISRENEAQLKEQSQSRASQIIEARASEEAIKREANLQSEHVKRLNYLDRIQVTSDVAPKRPFEAIQILREWIPKAGETDQRGFEWFHLFHTCGGDIALFSMPADLHLVLGVMRLSPDGRRIYAIDLRGLNSKIYGWDVRTGKLLDPVMQFGSVVPHDIAFDCRGDRLLVPVGDDALMQVTSLTSQSSHWCFRSLTEKFACYRVVADLNRPVVLSILSPTNAYSSPAKLVWNSSETGQQLGTISWPRGRVSDLVLDPTDGSTIVAVSSTIEVYNSNRDNIQRLEISNRSLVHALALSRDGTQLAISTDQQQIFLCRKDSHKRWQLVSSTPCMEPVVRHEDGGTRPMFKSIHFDATGKYLFFQHGNAMVMAEISSSREVIAINRFADIQIRHVQPLHDGLTAVWNSQYRCGLWRPSRQIAPLEGHLKEVWTVAHSHQGNLLASGSDDETARLWDLSSGGCSAELKGHSATITAVAFSPDDSLLATASLDGTVMVWDVASREHVKTFKDLPTEIRAIAWFSDGRRLAIADSPRNGTPNRILVWDLNSNQIAHKFRGFNDRIQSVLVTPDQENVIGVSDDWTIRRFRVSGQPESDVPQSQWRSDEPIRCGILVDRGRKLATGDNKGVIRIWDQETGAELDRLNLHTSPVLCMALSPDGKVLASGGVDRVIYLWDLATGRRILALRDLPAQVNGLAFSPAGDVLTAALHDGSIKHFYAPRFEPLQFETKSSEQ